MKVKKMIDKAAAERVIGTNLKHYLQILHVTQKPWKSVAEYGADKWWSYAEKTDFYGEITEKYSSAFERFDEDLGEAS